VSLHYANVLTLDPSTSTKIAKSRTSLKGNSFPKTSPDGIHWASPKLKVDGHWVARAPGIERDFMKTHDGVLQWKCLQPHARASIQMDQNHHLEGLGYVERMDLSISPWQLPINKLRWGRFLSDQDALVWIQWDGDDGSHVHVFFNGTEISDCSIDDIGVTFDHGRVALALRDRSVLREGALVSTALSMIPGINKLFPQKILQTHECKWLSKGRLTVGDAPPREGWAIHEVVRFS
jgi:hypothetical protein